MKLSEVKSCIAGYNAIHEKTSIKIQLKFKSSISLVSVASVRTRKDREPGSSRVQMDRTNFKEMNIRLNIRITAPNLCNRGGEYNVHYYELKKAKEKAGSPRKELPG